MVEWWSFRVVELNCRMVKWWICVVVDSSNRQMVGMVELCIVVESSNRRLVEYWSCGFVELSNGGMMVKLMELSNRRVVKSSNRRMVEWWNSAYIVGFVTQSE